MIVLGIIPSTTYVSEETGDTKHGQVWQINVTNGHKSCENIISYKWQSITIVKGHEIH